MSGSAEKGTDVVVGNEPDPWGPTVAGGARGKVLKRVLGTLGVLSLVLVAAIGTTGILLVQRAEANLTRVPVEELATPTAPSDARHFLLVGSDARDGLDDEDRDGLPLGEFDGQRSDTMIYVTISADRSQVTLISLPRDLVVERPDGGIGKLTEQFAAGPDALIEALQRNYGLPVNHYAQVSLGGFLDVVETLGGVTITLDEPLDDPKSGAQFPAGTIDMDPAEALSYVRSRVGTQADYERIARQQTFLRAVLSELIDGRILTSPTQLFGVVDDLSRSVTTDENLGIDEMRYLADDLRDVVSAGVPMTTFPSYSQRISGVDYVLPYRPGAEAIREAVLSGESLPERATREEAGEVAVALWSGGRTSSGTVVQPTLVYAGYQVGGAGSGPSELDAGTTTVVYAVDGADTEAEQVAAALGTEVEELPEDVDAPEGADVVVAVGDDAAADDGA